MTQYVTKYKGYPIRDAEAREQLNNIANQLGVDEQNNFVELQTTDKTVIGAINEVFQSASNGKSLIAQAITGKGVNASNTDTFTQLANKIGLITVGTIDDDITTLGEKLYTFGAISDIHHNSGNSWSAKEDMERTYPILEKKGCQFVCISGDLCYSSLISEITEFKQVRDDYCNIPVYVCKGNHDTEFTEENWLQYTGCNLQHEVKRNNGQDIFLFIDINSNENTVISWLQSKFTEHEDKRIFLFLHYPLPDTAGLKTGQYYGFESTSTFANSIRTLIESHKKCYVFTGHTHFLFEAETDYPNINVYNDNNNIAYTIHIPSNAYPRRASGEVVEQYSQGYVVDVYEQGIVLKGIDFTTGNYLSYKYVLTDLENTTVTQNSIIISKAETNINEGSTDTFTVKLSEQPTSDINITISKDNDNVTLDKTTLTFTSTNYDTEQTVTITASHDESLFTNMSSVITISATDIESKTVSVTIVNIDEESETVNCTGITLNKTSLDFTSADSQTLVATVEPSNTTDVITWESSDTSIATVNNGVITPVGTGSCVITVKCGNQSTTCNVNVTYTVITWQTGVMIDKSTGAETASDKYSASNYISYNSNNNNKLIVTPSDATIRICYYDADKNFLSCTSENLVVNPITTTTVNIPSVEGASYIRLRVYYPSATYAEKIQNSISVSVS